MNIFAPSLSIVACSRNDDHGVYLLERCSLFVKGLIAHCNTYNLKAELILVEWNPPADRPLLKDVLPLPEKNDLLSVRFIIVPKKIHQSIPNAGHLPLHQMIAKNVGIRRARSPFVLCTNNDLLFSDELFKFLVETELQRGVFYRANRRDVPRDIDFSLSVPNLLIFCKKNFIKIHGKHTSYPEIHEIYRGINRFRPYSWILSRLSRFRQKLFPRPSDLLITLDVQACGDFTLMSKKDWLDIGGYLEVGAYPVHLDSLALIAARLREKKQVILPPRCCAYHISHEDGWELADPIRTLLNDIARPKLSWRTVEHLAVQFNKNKKHIDLNPDNWGYSEEDFTEYIFGPE